ncbi:MAG TPA: hypothetical protein VHY30_08605 [Verrucomicrobiae bacterium]|jgi:hypothetical protein|nr:hypothetical protein [Verrucomicrobiae bacterium]
MLITQQQLEPLIPAVIKWAESESSNALKLGVPLNEIETDFARKIGIQFPEKVRLLKLAVMPKPSHPELLKIAAEKGLDWSQLQGLTLGYAIFIQENFWRNTRLVVHELAHTFQYERHGGLSLLRQFVLEYFIDGYLNSSLEREAVSVEEKFFGPR